MVGRRRSPTPNGKAFDRSLLIPGEESVIVLVVPNPEPGDPFAVENADGSVFARDAN